MTKTIDDIKKENENEKIELVMNMIAINTILEMRFGDGTGKSLQVKLAREEISNLVVGFIKKAKDTTYTQGRRDGVEETFKGVENLLEAMSKDKFWLTPVKSKYWERRWEQLKDKLKVSK